MDGSSRQYRRTPAPEGLVGFEVREKESDLWLAAHSDLTEKAREIVLSQRKIIEGYASSSPFFYSAMEPMGEDESAPEIVRDMLWAARLTGVGPMAGVAGALAEKVGEGLLSHTPEVIVENGGDVYLNSRTPRVVKIFSYNRYFSDRLGILIPGGRGAFNVCSSSGTFGHSFSFGKADAAAAIAAKGALADAAATAIGNRVRGEEDIEAALNWGKSIDGIEGIVIIVNKKLAVWGNFKIVGV